MRPVSAAFLTALRGSHQMVADARVLTSYQEGVNPSGIDIPIVSGDVSMDASASIRATLALTTDGNQLWSTEASGLLTPYGNEIFVRRGIDYGDGTREWVSQGYFRITDVQQDNNINNAISITAFDRMSNIIDSRLTEPRQFSIGTLLTTVVSTLVHEVYPLATINWQGSSSGDVLLRTLVTENEDRYQFIDDLVTSYGKIWYWDYNGELIVKDPPDPLSPVYTVNAGAGGVLISFSRSISREGAYNAVVVNGQGTDDIPPVHVVVIDNEPLSATYWYGPFGQIPKFYASSFITTEGQATSAGTAMLQQSRGLPYNINFDTVPNPALEPLDPVLVFTGDRDEVHVMETISLPLTAADAQTGTTREQRVTSVIEPMPGSG
jgi:hypothetical protein